ncbi:MAG: integrase/recombinase XerD [Saprospiraceae bacterium]|jgi:integrase/recombinase XerD
MTKDITKVVGSLDEIAAIKSEIVDRTPFDSYDNNLLIKAIDERLSGLYELIKTNPEITQEYVEKAVEPINHSLDELHFKIDQLLPKDKKQRNIQPLRDPVDNDLFPLFLVNAGSEAIYQRDLKYSQLVIAYTILYHTGVRINEIRTLTREDINDAIKISQFNLIHHKTKKAHIHILSDKAIKDLRNIDTHLKIVFDKHQSQYLFGKSKPMNKKSLIRMINHDLKSTCELAKLPFNIKSHSFRINLITNLLKVTSVHKVAEIIGHDDIRSTMKYQRYALSKDEIKNLLSKIEDK